MPHTIRSRRSLLSAALTLQLACATWEPQTVAPAQYVEAHHPTAVRVRTAAGRTDLYAPRVSGDSLVGQAGPADLRPVGVRLAEVQALESLRTGKDEALLTKVVVAFVATVVVVTASMGGGEVVSDLQ